LRLRLSSAGTRHTCPLSPDRLEHPCPPLQWKERIAEVLKQQGGLTERQIMGAIGDVLLHSSVILLSFPSFFFPLSAYLPLSLSPSRPPSRGPGSLVIAHHIVACTHIASCRILHRTQPCPDPSGALAEHDTQHTRGVLRNMLKAGIVRRERGENNAFSYVLESNVDIAATRIRTFFLS